MDAVVLFVCLFDAAFGCRVFVNTNWCDTCLRNKTSNFNNNDNNNNNNNNNTHTHTRTHSHTEKRETKTNKQKIPPKNNNTHKRNNKNKSKQTNKQTKHFFSSIHMSYWTCYEMDNSSMYRHQTFSLFTGE